MSLIRANIHRPDGEKRIYVSLNIRFSPRHVPLDELRNKYLSSGVFSHVSKLTNFGVEEPQRNAGSRAGHRFQLGVRPTPLRRV